MLTKYWITFVPSEELLAYSLGLGAGVTAFDDTDAMSLLADAIGRERLPAVQSVASNVRFDDLERNHVQKNLGNMAVRGVWYPNLNR
jgi:hypothetical protein